MGAIGWTDVAALLTSVGFGALSALFPVASAEAYVVASQVSQVAGPVVVALGLAVGQTVGKVALFYGVRRGKESAPVRHRRESLRARPAGPARARVRAVLRVLLALVGRKRWGLPITFVAAVVGLPPLYAVALLAGATRMRIGYFAAVVLAGRAARFVLMAYGVGGMHLGRL
jgi:membrane protein YqaA with SNARE-associated domain